MSVSHRQPARGCSALVGSRKLTEACLPKSVTMIQYINYEWKKHHVYVRCLNVNTKLRRP